MSLWEKVFGPKQYTSKSGDKISKTSDGKLTIDRSRKTNKGNRNPLTLTKGNNMEHLILAAPNDNNGTQDDAQ